jgi:hypothetical protein
MIWPSNKVGGAITINGARGFDRSIADRFDLTLECIRRYSLAEPSPTGLLSAALGRYPEFFALFGDFEGLVDFFLLQDLVDEATSTVKLFTPFEDFTTSPLPGTVDAYRRYCDRAVEFIEAQITGSPLTTAADRASWHPRARGERVQPTPIIGEQ